MDEKDNLIEFQPNNNDRVTKLIDIAKPIYDTASSNHSWEHIQSCLKNADLIINDQPELQENSSLVELTKIAIIFHDFDRTASKDAFNTTAASIGLTSYEIQEILIALNNHNKPKNKWTDSKHILSSIVYDADKMDTTLERFSDTKMINGISYPTTDNDFYAYAFMVRDSTTFKIAYDTISGKLPESLQINPANSAIDGEQVKRYVTHLREIWKDARLPEKRTVAKLILMATENQNYTDKIVKNYKQITPEEISKLSDTRRSWFDYIVELKDVSEYFLSSIDKLAQIANDPLFDRQKIFSTLKEKIFIYDSFMRAIMDYPTDKENDLILLMNRTDVPEIMHKNYADIAPKIASDLSLIDEKDVEKRRNYFREMIHNKIYNLSHYSPLENIDALRAGRRIMDKLMNNLFEEHNEKAITDLINKSLETEDQNISRQLIRYFRQDALRATDRVNDAMRTDRYIYTLLTGQTIDAPVRKLPHIYKLNGEELKNHGLHYYSPTHPQAFHIMKMQRPHEEMPKIIEDSIDFFVHGMYLPEDFVNLYVDIFAVNFGQDDMNQDKFNYLFNHIVVNEESEVTKNPDDKFVSDHWLELDFGSRRDSEWISVNKALTQLNDYCRKIGVIPFFRPYAVVNKDVSTLDFASIEKNQI
ncbi:MAG: hypothetical protein WCT77_02230 [Bacteroidota bacterium]